MSYYSEIHHKLHLIKKSIFSEKEYGKIFMLHRVAPFEKERLYPNENMKITPDFLESKIIELKKAGYEFISLDDLYSDSLNKTKRKKIAVFTMDDGYSDNYYNAFPIFKKFSVPFTIYLTTGFQEKKCFLWWYILEDLLLENDSIKTGDGQIFDVASKKSKEDVFMKLRSKILSFDPLHFCELFLEMFSHYSFNLYEKYENMILSWAQIIELSKSDICTIGAHTLTHPVFKLLSKEQMFFEALESKKILESKINRPVEHFAYPFGSTNEIDKNVISNFVHAPFKTVAVAYGGGLMKSKMQLNTLPREMLVQPSTI